MREDIKSKNVPSKAVLLLDNAPAHPQLETNLQDDDGNINCYFSPPNSTTLIQPMDQSVIETMKRWYRKTFIQELVRDKGETLLKEINENSTIANEILVATSTALGLEDNEIYEWLRCDDENGHQILTDDEIIQQVNEDDVESETGNAECDGTDLDVAAPKAVDLQLKYYIFVTKPQIL